MYQIRVLVTGGTYTYWIDSRICIAVVGSCVICVHSQSLAAQNLYSWMALAFYEVLHNMRMGVCVNIPQSIMVQEVAMLKGTTLTVDYNRHNRCYIIVGNI